MHIAFLTSEYPHSKISHSAGIGTSIKNLANAISKTKNKVTIIVYGQEEDLLFTENNITFYLIKDKKYQFGKWFFYRKYIQNRLKTIIKNNFIEILEIPDWTGISAFMKFKIPVIIHFHGSDTYFCKLENRKQKFKNYLFEKLAVNGASGYIAPTNFAASLSKKLFSIDSSKKIKTIHYGLELDKFENSFPRDFENGLILYIGTIIRKKGVLELPAIFKMVLDKVPTARLILIGSDASDITTGSSSTWELMKPKFSVSELNKVSYLGKIPYNKVQDYIKKANICVFPSFAETLGMVTIESMSLKKAVVNTNIGWANELIIDKENGFLVHPKNHLKFANTVVSLLEDNELVIKIGESARKHIEENFDINKVLNEKLEFYKTFI